MQRVKSLILVCLFLMMSVGVIAAQEAALEPERVEVTATDDQILVGDYYPAAGEGDKPAVLLMHMFGSSRSAWEDFIPALTGAGYHVLNVDLRGHGETGGKKDWPQAVTDVQTWLDWLKTRPNVRPDALAAIGASVGSNLALVGCGNDEACYTAVALSPGIDYFGVQPLDSVVDGLKKRSSLLIASQNDRESADGVKAMMLDTRGEIGVQLFMGGLHGTDLLNAPRFKARLATMIVNWLNDHTPMPK